MKQIFFQFSSIILWNSTLNLKTVYILRIKVMWNLRFKIFLIFLLFQKNHSFKKVVILKITGNLKMFGYGSSFWPIFFWKELSVVFWINMIFFLLFFSYSFFPSILYKHFFGCSYKNRDFFTSFFELWPKILDKKKCCFEVWKSTYFDYDL